jgi:hypothetical protein
MARIDETAKGFSSYIYVLQFPGLLFDVTEEPTDDMGRRSTARNVFNSKYLVKLAVYSI